MAPKSKGVQPTSIFEISFTGTDTPVSRRVSEDLVTRHDELLHTEGQLAIDVLDTGKDLMVVAPMAGVIAREITISIQHDLLTIRGVRQPPFDVEFRRQYVHQECFWGRFSRTVVLPVDVKGELARAELSSGLLTIRIPKRGATQTLIPVRIVDE